MRVLESPFGVYCDECKDPNKAASLELSDGHGMTVFVCAECLLKSVKVLVDASVIPIGDVDFALKGPAIVEEDEESTGTDIGDGENPALNATYLMELSERIFRIAPIHGVDQCDYEYLRTIAFAIDEKAARTFIDSEDC